MDPLLRETRRGTVGDSEEGIMDSWRSDSGAIWFIYEVTV